MKVSKVVLIVVALHVLVIGGIFVFEGCSRAKAPTPDMAANETPADTNAAALPADSTAGLTPVTPAPTALTPVAPIAPVVPLAPAPAARMYVVKKNDTLTKIAKAEHVKLSELASANKLAQTAALKIGQKLTIPAKAEAPVTAVASAAAPTTVPAATAAPVAGGNTYTVKAKDSLWTIAKANHISLAVLKQANNLTSDKLQVNQKLIIPAGATPTASAAPPVATAEFQPGMHVESAQTTHVVDIGESLATIAKKYGVTVTDLMKANNITDGKKITVSQRLVIPSAQMPTVTTATPAVAAPIVSTGN